MTDEIRAALSRLDPLVDDHWTDAGLPRLGAVRAAGADASRADIQRVAPDFTREHPTYGERTDAQPSSGARASTDAAPDERGSERADVEKELAAAQGLLHEAQVRHKKAYAAMTNLIQRESRNVTPLALSVRAAQQNALRERIKQVERQQALAGLIKPVDI